MRCSRWFSIQDMAQPWRYPGKLLQCMGAGLAWTQGHGSLLPSGSPDYVCEESAPLAWQGDPWLGDQDPRLSPAFTLPQGLKVLSRGKALLPPAHPGEMSHPHPERCTPLALAKMSHPLSRQRCYTLTLVRCHSLHPDKDVTPFTQTKMSHSSITFCFRKQEDS